MTRRPFIKDLRKLESRQRFDTVLLVRSKDIREKKNGLPYMALVLADKTGSIDTKVWDNVAELANVFGTGDFVRVRGRVQIYNKQHQAVVTWLRRVPEDTLSLADFLPHTEFDIESMYSDLLTTIDGFSNPDLRRLLGSIFRDPGFARLYKRAPAAMRHHHAKIGGLLEHVAGMLKVAGFVASHYPELDADLLASGVLLHDAGKIYELTSERSFEYTDDGQLLGHIAIGVMWLDRHCDQLEGFPSRLKTLLLHLVLSHHGKQEFGSPVIPQFPEALALNFIDDLNAKLEMMREALDGIAGDSVWTARHRALGRSILDTKAFLRQGDMPERVDSVKPRPARPVTPTPEPRAQAVVSPTPPGPVPDPDPPPPVAVEEESAVPAEAATRADEGPVLQPGSESAGEEAPAAAPAPAEPEWELSPEPAPQAPVPASDPSTLEPVEAAGPGAADDVEEAEPVAAEPAAEAPAGEEEPAPEPVKALRSRPAPLPSKVPPSTAAPPAPPPLPMQPTLFSGQD